ncbi:protein G1-like [Panicum virgatum]|uniref:ALOG domain-containing protein n=1 Tax=Panicum virgatum TaxID=38727 RepID=A0A8T0VXC0_PANVG|nr:protein G1-like [Panicum virgatum]KAG2639820.1 hypothetical protein PVAP13_2KG047348 [Panicum virgatum]
MSSSGGAGAGCSSPAQRPSRYESQKRRDWQTFTRRGTGPARPENAGDGAGVGANPFAARAVRLYLRDVRAAQARAHGISYSGRKKKRNKPQQQGTTCAASKQDGHGGAGALPHGNTTPSIIMAPAVPPPHHHSNPPPPPPPAYLTGVPFECCDHGSVFGGPTAANGAAGFYLPLLFNTFG